MSQRQALGLSNATINRELSLLGKMLRLAQEPPTHADAAHSSLAGVCAAIRFFRARRL